MLGQNLMVTGVTVVMVHAKKYLPLIMYCMKPLVTVSTETTLCAKNLTCDCIPVIEPNLCAKLQICTISDTVV